LGALVDVTVIPSFDARRKAKGEVEAANEAGAKDEGSEPDMFSGGVAAE